MFAAVLCWVERFKRVWEEIQELGTWEGTSASRQRAMRERGIAKKRKRIAARVKGASHSNIESDLLRIGRNE